MTMTQNKAKCRRIYRLNKQIVKAEDGWYKIRYKDGTLSPESYYMKAGARLMLEGRFDSHAFTP